MLRILKQIFTAFLITLYASQASAMFIQPDWLNPTTPNVGTNRYSYSFNDPINRSDPTGNIAPAVAIGLGLLGAALFGGEIASDQVVDGEVNGNGLFGQTIQNVISPSNQDSVYSDSGDDSSESSGDDSESSSDASSGPPDPDDDDEKAAKLARDAKRMSAKALDKAAKNNGYRDAHSLKDDFGLSGSTDVFADKNGDLYGGNLDGSGNREPLGLNKDGY